MTNETDNIRRIMTKKTTKQTTFEKDTNRLDDETSLAVFKRCQVLLDRPDLTYPSRRFLQSVRRYYTMKGFITRRQLGRIRKIDIKYV